MKKSITLKELSKILGVSISTISKALNDSPEISHDTKTKVKELAALHKYQPNVLARNLKSGTTKTIAVVLPTVQNNFFTEVLLGIETEIEKTDYNIIISITNESFKKESKSVNNLSNLSHRPSPACLREMGFWMTLCHWNAARAGCLA